MTGLQWAGRSLGWHQFRRAGRDQTTGVWLAMGRSWSLFQFLGAATGDLSKAAKRFDRIFLKSELTISWRMGCVEKWWTVRTQIGGRR